MDRELSIEETAWRTRIRPDLLRALEDDEFDSIGHQAHVRSHLSSYARFLGMDPAEIVDQFEAMHQAAPSALEELDRQASESHKPPRARWITASAVSAGALLLAAIVGMLGGQAERPTAGSPASSLGAPKTNTFVPAAEARVRLELATVATTTLSVSVDGRQIFEGELPEGATRSFRARETLEVFAANAGAVRVTLNGTKMGSLGRRGSVERARFGPAGRIN